MLCEAEVIIKPYHGSQILILSSVIGYVLQFGLHSLVRYVELCLCFRLQLKITTNDEKMIFFLCPFPLPSHPPNITVTEWEK